VDILKIRDLQHCEHVLADLCRVLTISLKPFDLNKDSNLILSLGVSFWLETVRDQNIKEVTHSEAVISYLQGFLDVISQEENVPHQVQGGGAKAIEYEDNALKVIKFTKSNLELPKEEQEEAVDDDTKEADTFDDYFRNDDYDENDDDWEPPERRLEQLCLPSPAFSQTIKSEPKSTKEKKVKTKKSKAKKKVYCDYCGNEFVTAFRAAEHVDECHPEKKEEFDKKYLIYECVKPGCQKAFYIHQSLSKHYKKFHKDFKQSCSRSVVNPEKAVAKCAECNRSFKIVSNYEDHMEEHKHGLGTKLFECDVCKQKFHFRTLLEKHKLRHADISLICPDCGKTLPSKKKMYRHLEYHKKGTYSFKEKECTICNKMLLPNKYKTHMFKFHDQGVEFCDHCGKKCQSTHALERHILAMHMKEKNYCCNICGKKFATDQYLKRHIDAQHSDKFKYNCDQCGKGFSVKQSYEGHLNMHLGLKPYKCQGCGTGFQNQSNLMAHVRKSCKFGQ